MKYPHRFKTRILVFHVIYFRTKEMTGYRLYSTSFFFKREDISVHCSSSNIWPEWGQLVGPFKCGNGQSASTECGEFLE
jgi:hypothetical protein